MLKFVIVFAGLLAIFAATSDAQARGFRQSRGSCPNGQCYAWVPAADTVAVAGNHPAETSLADAPAAPAIEAPAAPAVDAPAAPISTGNVAIRATTFGRSSFRLARGGRFFRRR